MIDLGLRLIYAVQHPTIANNTPSVTLYKFLQSYKLLFIVEKLIKD